ncbi:hypothetical protein AB0G02_33265, partial [Actinosynnema sp. NPDC023658]|uniref:hypothetical protein n=1 Tax=Actinosynnema sp. NPDC023658 TaxID=3155465 RepID=UPI0033EC30D4
EVDGRMERRDPSMEIAGNTTGTADVPGVGAVERVVEGDPTLIVTDTVELAVRRRLDADAGLTGATLVGTWPGQATPVPLASATPR